MDVVVEIFNNDTAAASSCKGNTTTPAADSPRSATPPARSLPAGGGASR